MNEWKDLVAVGISKGWIRPGPPPLRDTQVDYLLKRGGRKGKGDGAERRRQASRRGAPVGRQMTRPDRHADLLAWRLSRGLTQRGAAAFLGASSTQYFYWETLQREVPAKVLTKIKHDNSDH